MNFPPESAKEIEFLHSEMSAVLERIAWAILRDWPLAADAVQETFVLLTEKWASVAPDNRRGWLVKTVQLTSQNLRRKKLRTERIPEDWYRQLPRRSGTGKDIGNRTENDTEVEYEKQEQLEQLASALAGLPDSQRQVVKLRLESERTFAEIADQLNIPLGTVLSRMRLALEKLRKLME